MFSPRQIIYITPFYFKNGNTPKPKYLVVLANESNKTIVASLTTRTNHVPSFVNKSHGCINIDDRCYNAYVFDPGKIIGDAGFFFPDPRPTFIYGNEVDDFDVTTLESVYPIEGVDYEIKDTLKQDEYESLIKCLQASRSVKRKIKKLLSNL
ncbi:hypothetical protein D3H65_27300 [Paraflavitalea soli]|uniref:Type II toxin-antitoxin system PemK/MazF family toxin n=1 Tax=Paraflavitalea soli TaxID=2315862 RepID=A0A3B7MSH5_9BACT|nr:hypothetical protein [Paraflavitalea soli]AXY77462.1 hypothetical protein D3H65_27300 [Paraflavitalea soli]